MTNHAIKKGNVKLTVSIDKRVLEKYKKYCEGLGLVISKQLENFMSLELKKRWKFKK